jgi:hypothetical protein
MPMDCPSESTPGLPASRGRPAAVPPVIHEGVRYERLDQPVSEGLPPGGHVVATKIDSGERLWITSLYRSRTDPHIEADVQWTPIKSMQLDAALKTLVIEDGKGRRYCVDLDGQVRS